MTSPPERAPGCRRGLGPSAPVLTAVLCALCPGGTALAGGLLPDAVVEFTPGTGAGFGQGAFPANVLTGPDGGNNPPFEPSDDPANLLSLGNGGSITLRWSGDVILDGPGPDFIIFENALITLGTGVPFFEAGVVEAGRTPGDMVRLPFQFTPPAGWNEATPYAIPFEEANFQGLAGTRPTYATPTNGIDPADPALAGGNAFDLADFGLPWARCVRIVDPGVPGAAGSLTGTNGLFIYDVFLSANGFDLDTIVAIHHGPPPQTSATANTWQMYE